MERLTRRTAAGVANLDYPQNIYYHDRAQDQVAKSTFRQRAIDRLAAYEDTGLEPEEIDAIVGLASENCSRAADAVDKLLADDAELDAYRALGTVEELSALVKTQEEGRVTIKPLPAKKGAPRPYCFYGDGANLWCLGLSHEGDDEPIDRCKQCWYCESGDYAVGRAEAEAALRGGGDEG